MSSGKEQNGPDFPPATLFVFNTLEREERMTRGELAEETRLPVSTIDHAVRRLEDAGLARRDRKPTDTRQVVVSLVDDYRPRASALGLS
jgi:DNA-binding MarR family transcriptional regulator